MLEVFHSPWFLCSFGGAASRWDFIPSKGINRGEGDGWRGAAPDLRPCLVPAGRRAPHEGHQHPPTPVLLCQLHHIPPHPHGAPSMHHHVGAPLPGGCASARSFWGFSPPFGDFRSPTRLGLLPGCSPGWKHFWICSFLQALRKLKPPFSKAHPPGHHP